MTHYNGIDYGRGTTNIDKNGIRYGVIQANHVGQVWYEDSEPDYGEPTCPECGNPVVDAFDKQFEDVDLVDWKQYDNFGCIDYVCKNCEHTLDTNFVWPDEPFSFNYDDGDYKCHQGRDDSDIFIGKSPYFTYAQFCSPCAPGAIYLENEVEPDQNQRGYCFGHDWFESGKAPYHVYSVGTGLEITVD